jgi:hypothetical protein
VQEDDDLAGTRFTRREITEETAACEDLPALYDEAHGRILLGARR